MTEKTFHAFIDRDKRTITIQGVKYAFDLFDALGMGQIGLQYRLTARKDGVITLQIIDTPPPQKEKRRAR